MAAPKARPPTLRSPEISIKATAANTGAQQARGIWNAGTTTNSTAERKGVVVGGWGRGGGGERGSNWGDGFGSRGRLEAGEDTRGGTSSGGRGEVQPMLCRAGSSSPAKDTPRAFCAAHCKATGNRQEAGRARGAVSTRAPSVVRTAQEMSLARSTA